MKNEFLSTYVANNLRACQLKQLSILEEMDRICQKHSKSNDIFVFKYCKDQIFDFRKIII